MALAYYNILKDETKPVGDRYFSIFQIKNIGTDQAIKYLMDGYTYCGSSILLKHELLYVLGQLPQQKYDLVKQFLLQKMTDESQNNLSRHESAESLANYFDKQIIKYYQQYINSKCLQLKYTCIISKQKLQHLQLKQYYGHQYHQSKQSAAPFNQIQFKQFLSDKSIDLLFKQSKYLGILCSSSLSLWEKYRVLYYMRNKKTPACIQALCKLLSKEYYKTQISLLKHQICFILGQIGYHTYQNLIRQCIQNEDEQDIVRHEALAAVASQSKDPKYLQQFTNQKYSQLIRQSALVAIHSINYWKNDQQ